ncbi:MAG: tetratricopeptide repeat protein, partial [Desulfatitalea sp.]|nr:tetratricopeptide repeat protein [Desulfatitalea sp.]
GHLYLAARQLDKARSEFAYILEKQPRHERARLLEAGVLVVEEKRDAALQQLRKLKSEGYADPQLFLWLAAIQLSEGDEEGGRQILREGISANPDSINLRGMLTRRLIQSKAYDEAIAQVKKVIQIEPEKKAYKFMLASLYWDAGQKDDAHALLEKLIAGADEPAMVRIPVAEFYTNLGEEDRALSIITTGIEQDPKNLKLRLALAGIQRAVRGYDQAKATLLGAIDLTKDDADPDLLRVKNELARIDLARGDIEEAKVLVGEVIAVNGKDVDAQFTAGQIYLRERDGVNAVSAFRTVVAEKPDFIGGHLHLAQAHLLNMEKQLAVNALDNGLSVNPDNSQLRNAMARIYSAEKDFDSAEKALRKIVEKNPRDLRAVADLADFLFAQKKEGEAIDIYTQMIKAQPKVPAGYLKLAAIYRAQEKNPSAVAILEQGYRNVPETPQILTELVKSYLAGGKTAKAMEILEARLAANDQEPIANNLLGEIYLVQKRYDEAILVFKKAVDNRPEWQVPHNNLARAYLAQGKADEAIARMNEALRQNPRNKAAYMTLGHLYHKGGQLEKAIDVYEKALDRHPDLWPAANNLAYLLIDNGDGQGRMDQALAMALRAIKLQPERPDVIDTLGWVYYQRGETDLAIAELEKALERAPDSEIINYHLAMALMKANRTSEARGMLRKALAGEDFPERDDAQKAWDTMS